MMQVATFIVQKILLDEMGLSYICATADRFFAVSIRVVPVSPLTSCSAITDLAVCAPVFPRLECVISWLLFHAA
jgi:CCR4-NOT transcription complex subunit 9